MDVEVNDVESRYTEALTGDEELSEADITEVRTETIEEHT